MPSKNYDTSDNWLSSFKNGVSSFVDVLEGAYSSIDRNADIFLTS